MSAADFEVLRTTGTHGPLSYKTDGTHSFKFLAQALRDVGENLGNNYVHYILPNNQLKCFTWHYALHC